MQISKSVSVTVRLEASEQFRFETPTGPIMVSHMSFSPGDFRMPPRGERCAHARGPGIKKDGSVALIDRSGYIPFRLIPTPILEGAIKALRDTPEISL